LSDLQRYRGFKGFLESGQPVPEQYRDVEQQFRDAMQQKVTEYEDHTGPIWETVKQFNSPEYRQATERALNGSKWEGMTGSNVDFGSHMIAYMHRAKQQTGEYPTPEHMFRFAIHGKKLPEDQWGSYLAGSHNLSGDEIQEWKTFVPQVALGTAAGKLSPAVVRRMMANPKGLKAMRVIAGKGSLPQFVAGHAKQGIFSALGRVLRRKSAMKGGIKIGSKLGSKGVGNVLTKSAPGLNLILDSFDLGYDPKAGTYSFNPRKVSNNIKNVDEMMETREQHGTQFLGGAKRNMLYNQGVGGLRGWVQPVTTMATARRRQQGIKNQGIDAVLNEGVGGALQYMKGVAGTVPDYFAGLYNATEPTEGKKIRERGWGTTRAAPTAAELKARRRR